MRDFTLNPTQWLEVLGYFTEVDDFKISGPDCFLNPKVIDFSPEIYCDHRLPWSP